MALHPVLQGILDTAVVETKGPFVINEAGEVVPAPTTAELAAQLQERVLAVIGQTTPPPATGWRMSNNSLSKRLDALQASLDAVPGQLLASTTSVLSVVGELIAHVTEQYGAALTAQGQAFTAEIAKARTDLHAEILGSAGPLLDLIHQLQAVDLADDSADAAIHNQLLTALGQQASQLTQLLATTGTLTTNQAATASSLAQAQTALVGHTQDIAALRLVDTAVRADLTASQQQLATTTTTANSAQALAASHTPLISQLQTDVAARLLTTRIKGLQVLTPAMAVNFTATISVTWPAPFADDKYVVVALPETSAALGSFTLISHTATGCVVSVKNVGLVALLAGAATLHLMAYKY